MRSSGVVAIYSFRFRSKYCFERKRKGYGNHSSTPHEKKSTPAIAWCPESRFRLSWLASSINAIRGADILPRLLLLQQPVKVTRCGLQWLFPTKKMAVLPYCGYSYVLAFATRMFPGLAVRSLLNFRCLAFVLKVGVKVVVILVVWAVGSPHAFIKMVVDLAYTNQPGTTIGTVRIF